jgi:thiol-disulfide isomerase/thioredoxin
LNRSFFKLLIILFLCLGWIGSLPHCGKGKKEAIQVSAPDFTLKTLDDQEITLSALKGKVVLLDFWATWCGPCRESIPHLIQLGKKFQETEFKVIGMSMDRGDADAVRRFVKSMDIPYSIIITPDEVARHYGVRGLPTAILIDKSGKVHEKIMGFNQTVAKQLEAKVADLLSEKP